MNISENKMRGIEMNEVARNDKHVYWMGIDDDGRTVYNITPVHGYKPHGGYYRKEWILAMKKPRIDLFPNT